MDQFRSRIELEGVEMEEELENEEQEEVVYDFDRETEKDMEGSDNELREETDKENEL